MLRDVFWASNSPTLWPKHGEHEFCLSMRYRFAVSMGRFIIAVTGNHFVHRQVRPFPAHFSRLSPAEPSSSSQGGHHCRQRRKLKILETTHQFLLNLSVVTNPPCSDVLFLIWSWNIASACGHFRMCIGARVPQIPAASDAIGPIPSSCR